MKKYGWVVSCTLLLAACTPKEDYLFRYTYDGGEEIKITAENIYTPEKRFGFDRETLAGGDDPFYFSVDVPDGNYKVTLEIGSKKDAGRTTVRGESRRLFFNDLHTAKGEIITRTFVINKRNTLIGDGEEVKIKLRERSKLNWDDKLTLEFNGVAPRLRSLKIEKAEDVITLFLCGNSTVVDQDNEPWGSWGQMITAFFDDRVSVANYAESGESANTFIGAKRLKKALTQMKPGDYIFVEFGHNDQKQKGPGKGAYLSFTESLKEFIAAAREKEANLVFVTPTQRRRFDEERKIVDTHEDYPDAMRKLAADEYIPLIDLHAMTRTLYEAMGVEESKNAFVHYPAGTYPGQTEVLADNTHFNTYGAYQIAQCVVEGMKAAGLEITNYLRTGYTGFDSAQPDALETFHWDESPFAEVEKPDGN
ncbi:MAG: rhamnogalacturonan acetylesterase [Bacteroides sp.]|nr:rhamnogalacturonan acetylesterase [Bacteroides sp.]